MEQHRRQWLCEVCHDFQSVSRHEFIEHLEHTHSDEFTCAQVEMLAKTCSRPVDYYKASNCPLCCWHDTISQTIPQAQNNDVVSVTVHQFMEHLAMHLEQIALLAATSIPHDGADATMTTFCVEEKQHAMANGGKGLIREPEGKVTDEQYTDSKPKVKESREGDSRGQTEMADLAWTLPGLVTGTPATRSTSLPAPGVADTPESGSHSDFDTDSADDASYVAPIVPQPTLATLRAQTLVDESRAWYTSSDADAAFQHRFAATRYSFPIANEAAQAPQWQGSNGTPITAVHSRGKDWGSTSSAPYPSQNSQSGSRGILTRPDTDPTSVMAVRSLSTTWGSSFSSTAPPSLGSYSDVGGLLGQPSLEEVNGALDASPLASLACRYRILNCTFSSTNLTALRMVY
ncbi:hypothetical protein LTR17_003766 [Elasticomyces elasticus]|nr:hypothetical protein LTR17_003766 [Elasticomyces elasticus]